MGAKCFGRSNTAESPSGGKKNSGVPMSGADKNRVSSTDQAILDVKARQRKIRTYMEKMEQQDKDATTKCKELIKAG